MVEMKDYLYNIAVLEGEILTQKNIQSTLRSQMAPLGRGKNYEKPTRPVWRIRDFFLPNKEHDSLFILYPIGGILFAIELIRGFISFIMSGPKSLDNLEIAAENLCNTLIPSFIQDTFIGMILFMLIYFVVSFSPFITNYFKYIYPCHLINNLWEYFSYHKTALKSYDENLDNYYRAVQADEERVERELAMRQQIQNQIGQVQFQQKKTSTALAALYDLEIIHPKYRHNMVAIASFYDYFDTGICSTLTGPHGAYSRYEEDLRFQRIYSRLDVIISKLDELIDTQRTIAQLLEQANDTLSHISRTNNRMMQKMSRIEENSDLTAYNTQCAARSSRTLENIAVYQLLRS